MNRNKIKIIFFCGFVITVASMAILLREIFAPADLVEVNLEQVPSNVSALYLVTNMQGKIFPLKWYQSMVYPFLADPKDAGEQWYWTKGGSKRKGKLQWVSADSYGILARLDSGRWIVWWLRPEWINGPSSWRYILGGGEKVTIQTLGIELAKDAPKSLLDQVKTGDP